MIFLNQIISLLLRFLIVWYQAIFSVFAGRQCRFEPTCSHYALEALKKHSIINACVLIIKRLWKCSPLSSYAGDWHYDPVPFCYSCDNDRKKSTSQKP